MKTIIFLTALLWAGLSSAPSATAARHTKLFYFPMHENTYEPINIESEFNLSSLVEGKEKDLLEIVTRHDEAIGKIHNDSLRVEMVLTDGTVIKVDLMRNVQYGKETYRLSKESYEDLYKAIKELLPYDMTF